MLALGVGIDVREGEDGNGQGIMSEHGARCRCRHDARRPLEHREYVTSAGRPLRRVLREALGDELAKGLGHVAPLGRDPRRHLEKVGTKERRRRASGEWCLTGKQLVGYAA